MAPDNKPKASTPASAPAPKPVAATEATDFVPAPPTFVPAPQPKHEQRPRHIRVESLPKNPPDQPVMIPAKQVYGATGEVLDPEAQNPRRERGGVRVVATKTGYYADKLQRPGDVFTIHDDEFSTTWMAYVDSSTPESNTSPNAALRREHDAIVSGAPRTDGIVTGRDDVPNTVPTGTANPLGAIE